MSTQKKSGGGREPPSSQDIGRVSPSGPRSDTPSPPAVDILVIRLAVAMRVFDGTQSVRTQAPPIPSRSTMVTSAPS
jgi:hypothetical protein